MVASEQHGNEEQEKTDATDQKESFKKKAQEKVEVHAHGIPAGRDDSKRHSRSWALRCPSRLDTA